MKELLGKTDLDSLPAEHQENMLVLLGRTNQVRAAYGMPMIVSSGYRTMADHLRIYAAKGITDMNSIPMKSKHLIGAAVDIGDPNKDLQFWVLNNLGFIKEIGLWCEDFKSTRGWVHFQSQPYPSWILGKSIFFIP